SLWSEPHRAERDTVAGVAGDASGYRAGTVGEEKRNARRLGTRDLRDLFVELGALARIGLGARLAQQSDDERDIGRVLVAEERPEHVVRIEADRRRLERERRIRGADRGRIDSSQTGDDPDLREIRRNRLRDAL